MDIENCKKAAAEFDGSRDEFQRKYNQAYRNLYAAGLLDEVLPSKREERSFERFLEIAKNCKTKEEVREKDASICSKAREEGWWEYCPWIPKLSQKPRKWPDEKRWAAALQCKTRSEYREKFVGAYTYDKEHNLLDRYTHFEKPIAEGRDPNAEDYVIYVYRDEEHKVVYVGLTYEGRKAQRHKEHVCGRKEDDGSITFDVAAKYWQGIGKPLPQPRYVMDELHIDDVGYFEDWYIKQYEKAGWTVLNIAKGGSLGGAKVKWNTYEAVKAKAMEYETRSQFCHGCSQAANKAYHTYTEDGVLWIDTFDFLKDSHTVRSEAARKNRKGKKLSEEHKKHIRESLKKFYSKAA